MRDEDRKKDGLKAGKGTRIEMTEKSLERLAGTMQYLLELYRTSESPGAFMQALTLEQQSNTQYKRGQGSREQEYAALNKWIAIPTSAGEEFRMTVSLNDQGQFTLDFRGWWGG